MKKLFKCIFLLLSINCLSQETPVSGFNRAEKLVLEEKFAEAYPILIKLETTVPVTDTLYRGIIWYAAASATTLEAQYRLKEDFNNSLKYGIEALSYVNKGLDYFDANFAARQYWLTKNIIVSCFGLKKYDEAKKYKQLLYDAYKAGALPEGIDGYFNFDFFKWEGKNIWGYEWYPELGDPETEGSFSKIVYYVYSTNPDGSDKDQLYRLHVLKFHKSGNSVPFDYVLTKRLETAKNEVSGTLYSYTYKKEIDYVKLKADIIEVLKGNLEPDIKKKD